MAEEEERPHKSFYLFGRDISEIPCFRDSFLYGIGGGMAAGTLAFLGTSRARLATNIGFGTFFSGTIAYWFFCRYQWSKRRFAYNQLEALMKRKTAYEGTDVEKEIEKPMSV